MANEDDVEKREDRLIEALNFAEGALEQAQLSVQQLLVEAHEHLLSLRG